MSPRAIAQVGALSPAVACDRRPSGACEHTHTQHLLSTCAPYWCNLLARTTLYKRCTHTRRAGAAAAWPRSGDRFDRGCTLRRAVYSGSRHASSNLKFGGCARGVGVAAAGAHISVDGAPRWTTPRTTTATTLLRLLRVAVVLELVSHVHIYDYVLGLAESRAQAAVPRRPDVPESEIYSGAGTAAPAAARPVQLHLAWAVGAALLDESFALLNSATSERHPRCSECSVLRGMDFVAALTDFLRARRETHDHARGRARGRGGRGLGGPKLLRQRAKRRRRLQKKVW